MENEKKQDKSILDRVQSAFTGSENTKIVETPEVAKQPKQPKVKTPVMETLKPKNNKWEIKDRVYF